MPSDKSLVFIENHDTERGSDTLSYKDGATNTIANEFLLAYGYGTPQVYSGFAFDQQLRLAAGGRQRLRDNTDCSNGWVCVDRYQGVVGMVGFHNYVGRAPMRNWYDDNTNLIAFSRGDRGFFSTNNADDGADRHRADRSARRHVLRRHPRCSRTAPAPARR